MVYYIWAVFNVPQALIQTCSFEKETHWGKQVNNIRSKLWNKYLKTEWCRQCYLQETDKLPGKFKALQINKNAIKILTLTR